MTPAEPSGDRRLALTALHLEMTLTGSTWSAPLGTHAPVRTGQHSSPTGVARITSPEP